MNLLIVEDDVRLASALAHILEEAGHAVDTANDGETGYAYASQGKYDVAILDVMLPKKNGFDIVSDLRRTGIAHPGAYAHRTRCGARQNPRARFRRRRLHDQAVLARRTHGALTRAHPPPRRG